MASAQTPAALPLPGELATTATRLVQLFRGPSQPSSFPDAILSGLSSTDVATQQAAIVALRAYVRQLFFLEFPWSFMVSCIVTAAIIASLFLVGVPVILHRLYHGRLQVFRLERRMHGSYIVPHAINCFLLLEGLYGALTIAFNFIFYKLYHDHVQVWIYLLQPFRSLIWIPLYIGAFLTGWGSFYTAPGALDKPTASRFKTSAKGHLPWPLIVNLSCLGTPIALIVSLIPPVVLSSLKMTEAFNSYKRWDQSFQTLLNAVPAGTLVDQGTIEQFRSQGYDIFTTWTKSYYYVDIAYVLWGFWALLFLVFYVPAGGVLVYLLYRQVQRQKAILVSYECKLEARLAQEEKHVQINILTQDQPHAGHQPSRSEAGRDTKAGWFSAGPNARNGAPLEDIHEDRGASDVSQRTGHSGATASLKGGHDFLGLESALRQEPPASHQVHGAETPGVATQMGNVASLAELGELSATANAPSTASPPITPKLPSFLRKLTRTETASAQSLRKAAKRKRASISGGPMARYKYLRRCLVNLLILYLGIISAACFFGFVTIYLAAVEYEHALSGPNAVARSITVAGQMVVWVSAVFGALTIGSIVFRNFDNRQPVASQVSGGDVGRRRRFNRHGSKMFESGPTAADPANDTRVAAHDKARTLPAVPESVDMEASMMSVSRSKPHMPPNTSMKFAIASQSERPGGFVIRPDDPLASGISTGYSPEMEEASRSGYYGSASRGGGATLRPPPAVRAWLGREREATMSIPQDVTESFGLTSLPMVATETRSQKGLAEAAGEDPMGHYRTQDTTLAGYPSFDPEALKHSSYTAAPSSPVLGRGSKLSESGDVETPASKIAREWAQSQGRASLSMPETPTMGGSQRMSQMLDARLDEMGVSPSSPPRPSRDTRRLMRQNESPARTATGTGSSEGRF